MSFPSVHDFAAALHAAAAQAAPGQLDELYNPLLTAFEEVKSFRPLSVRLVSPPWEGAALAFEACWPDTHALLVAARVPAGQTGATAQLTLRRAGQMVYAVNSTTEQLATDVGLCLGRHIRRHGPTPSAPASSAPAPEASSEPAG